MAHSNGMGFFRRMNWGQYRDGGGSDYRAFSKKEAATEISEETLPPAVVCPKCGNPDCTGMVYEAEE